MTRDALAKHEAAVEASLMELDRTVERMKVVSRRSIQTSEAMARTAREVRPSKSNPHMRATTPEDAKDLTGQFNAIKRSL